MAHALIAVNRKCAPLEKTIGHNSSAHVATENLEPGCRDRFFQLLEFIFQSGLSERLYLPVSETVHTAQCNADLELQPSEPAPATASMCSPESTLAKNPVESTIVIVLECVVRRGFSSDEISFDLWVRHVVFEGTSLS